MKKTLLFIGALLAVSVLIFGLNITNQTVMNQTLVNEINSVNAQSNLPWTAALDKVFNGKTLQELSVMDGWKPLPSEFVLDLRSKAKKLTTTDNMVMGSYTMFDPLTMNSSTLPATYDLSDQFSSDPGISYVTPVKDQGFHGTCWAFSTVETFETALAKQGVVAPSNIPVLSPQFAAYHDVDWDLLTADNGWAIQDSNYDAGGNQYFSMYNAIRYGMPPASDFPYNAYENNPWTSWDPQNANWQKDLTYSQGTLLLLSAPEESYYYHVSYSQYVNAIKTMIMKYGSVSVSFQVPYDFYNYSTGVYIPYDPGSDYNPYVGGHAVQIVGWIDNYQASNGQTYNVWIVRNSWGTSWGMNGYWLQPMVTQSEYETGNIPPWKFSSSTQEYGSNWFFVPIFENTNTDYLAADFNNDGVVNSTDFDMLKKALSETNPSSETIAKYDISVPKDNRIDGNDLAEFMYLWNEAAKVGK